MLAVNVVGAVLALSWLAGCARPQGPSIRYAGDKAVQDTDWQHGGHKPPNAKTLFAMSRVLIAEGRTSDAMMLLRRVIHDTPTCLSAYVELAGIHMRQSQPSSAAEVLTAGLKVAPADPVMLNDLGVTYLALRQPEAALDAFQRAVAAAPHQSRYVANVALSQALLGQYAKALATYKQVMPPAQAHHNLAVVCERRGDNERATIEYTRAMILSKSMAAAADAAMKNAGAQDGASEGPASEKSAGKPAHAQVPPPAAGTVLQMSAVPEIYQP